MRLLWLIWALVFSQGALAAVAIPPVARVTDLTGSLSSAQRDGLDRKLAAFEQEQGSQLSVLMLPTTAPETIEQYALRVAEHWQLGRAKPDDGLMLVIARDDRAARIEVGYGLEGAIPDAVAKRIIEEVMVPAFRQGDFAGGIDQAVENLFAQIRKEPLPPPAQQESPQPHAGSAIWPQLLIGFLIVGQLLRRVLGRLFGGLVGGGLAFAAGLLFTQVLATSAMIGVAVFVLMLLGISPGGFVSGGRGGFGRGGFSGGGGGFRGGGGGFGGGGASGRW